MYVCIHIYIYIYICIERDAYIIIYIYIHTTRDIMTYIITIMNNLSNIHALYNITNYNNTYNV